MRGVPDIASSAVERPSLPVIADKSSDSAVLPKRLVCPQKSKHPREQMFQM